MYIVRWLMGHPFIAAVVLGALALLLTLGQEKKSKSVEQNTVIIEQPENTNTSLDNDSKRLINEAKKEEAQNRINLQSTDENIVLNQVQENEGDSVIKHSENNNLSTNNGSLVESVEISSVKNLLSNSQVSTTAASSDLESASTDELLQMAREAYWNNGLDEAADLYKKLIEIQPNVIEHKGELGNVYWKQGYPKKAAKLYLEIAAPMIDSGNSARVENMIGFIGLFFPEEAAGLSNKIQSK